MRIEDYTRVDIHKMYSELSTHHRINSSWRFANRKLLQSVRIATKLDNENYLCFKSPDLVFLFENWDEKDGVLTGIDFGTGLELLEPYLRREKISKIINKTT